MLHETLEMLALLMPLTQWPADREQTLSRH